MATCVVITDETPYFSDIVYHIESAMSTGTYSLMGIVMGILFGTLSYDDASILLAIIIALMEILTVYATYLLLLQVGEVTGRDLTKTDRAYLQWLSLLSIFIVSIRIPGILPSYAFYAFNMTCWQNDTFLAMRPFSILTFVYFIKLYRRFDDGLDKKNITCFAIFLFISTWMKPSFLIGFVPLLLVVGIWCLIKKTDKYTVFKRLATIIMCIVPPMICVFVQNALLYGDGDNSIIFEPLLLVNLRILNWRLAFTLFLLFPAITLLFECKKQKQLSFGYVTIWLLWLFENLIAFLLAEGGARTWAFNFAWGMVFSDGLLYVCSYYMWYRRLRSDTRFVVPFIEKYSKLSKSVASAYFVLGGALLIYLAYVGLNYFILICTGTSFANL